MSNIFGDNDVMIAPQATNRVRPAYKVKKLEGVVAKTVHYRDNKARKIASKVIEEPAGFMVYLMNGSSIRVKDIEGLKALGISALVPLIDGVTGETVGVGDL